MTTRIKSEVRTRRRALELSQEELARRAECSTSFIGMIEHGYQASETVMTRLEAALDEAEASP